MFFMQVILIPAMMNIIENKTVTSMECENIFTDHGRKTDNPIIK